jgi:EmrB/QacA subfamily drug resistance transporter
MDKRGLALAVVILAAVMDLLDGAVLNIVLPSIQRELGAGNAAAAWIASGYTLALGVLLTIGGRLGDLYGHRRVLTLSTVGFLVASLVCGMAPSAGVLIVARVLQGGMSAMMVPQALALIQLLYPYDGRGRALGLFATVAYIATASGAMLGAVLTEADVLGLSWRAVFLINLPLGVLVLAGTRLLPGSRPGMRTGLDLRGAILLATGLTALMVPLLQGSERGWSFEWMWPLPVAALALSTFVVREHRRFRCGLPGLMPTGLFRFAGFTGAVLINAAVIATVFGLFFTLTLYLQHGLDFSALQTAAMFLPWTLGMLATSTPASRLLPRYGRRVLEAGVLLLAAGLMSVALALSMAPSASPVRQLGPGLFVAGCGVGLVTGSVLTLGLAEIPARWAGLASGVQNNMQHLAGALGSAAIAAVYFTHLESPEGTPSDATGAFRVVVWCLTGLASATIAATRLMPGKRPRP